MPINIRIKRIYDEPEVQDGYRILVDRLWPRGVSKLAARIDLWPKELTPSNALRQWFHESPDRLDEFVTRYQAELSEHLLEIKQTLCKIDTSPWTLLTATKDLEHGHAAALKEWLCSNYELLTATETDA